MIGKRVQVLGRVAAALLASSIAFMHTACGQDDTVAVGYEAYNHTSTSINSVFVNSKGGVLNAPAYGGGGGVCCVVLPSKWRPGLTAVVKWEEDGDWLVDANGSVVFRDGKKVYVPRPFKQKTVFIQKYLDGDQTGRFQIHFFPGDDVKVSVLPYGPGHKDYPYPYPKKPQDRATP